MLTCPVQHAYSVQGRGKENGGLPIDRLCGHLLLS